MAAHFGLRRRKGSTLRQCACPLFSSRTLPRRRARRIAGCRLHRALRAHRAARGRIEPHRHDSLFARTSRASVGRPSRPCRRAREPASGQEAAWCDIPRRACWRCHAAPGVRLATIHQPPAFDRNPGRDTDGKTASAPEYLRSGVRHSPPRSQKATLCIPPEIPVRNLAGRQCLIGIGARTGDGAAPRVGGNRRRSPARQAQ